MVDAVTLLTLALGKLGNLLKFLNFIQLGKFFDFKIIIIKKRLIMLTK